MIQSNTTFQGVSHFNQVWKKGSTNPSVETPPPASTHTPVVESRDRADISIPQTIETKSGIHAEYQKSSLGTALKASLPAGALLPVPIILESFQGQGGNQVQAFVEKDGKKVALEAGTSRDGTIHVQLDANPNSPLLVFDPATMDYGLLAKETLEKGGSTHRNLAETVHSDGSRTLIQDHTVGRDGSESYHEVKVDSQGRAQGGAVEIDASGNRNWTKMLTTIDDGKVSMKSEAEPPRSLVDHTIDSFKNPFSFKSPLLSWLKDKKQAAGKVASALFTTYGMAAANYPAQMFPGLMSTVKAPAVEQSSPVNHSAPVNAASRPVKVLQGDITQFPADGVVTTVNSGGMWFGGIDGAIQRAAGGMYHGQLNPDNLQDGQVVVAGKNGQSKAQFNDVVFVVDDLKQPLQNLVYQGLKAADKAGMQSVNLPAFRTGVMAGAVESKEEAIKATADAIKKFQAENPSNLKDIQIVVYRDQDVARQFEQALA